MKIRHVPPRDSGQLQRLVRPPAMRSCSSAARSGQGGADPYGGGRGALHAEPSCTGGGSERETGTCIAARRKPHSSAHGIKTDRSFPVRKQPQILAVLRGAAKAGERAS